MAFGSTDSGRSEEARFRAIVRDSFGVDLASPETATSESRTDGLSRLPFGIAAHRGTRGWVVSSSSDPAALGGVLLWASRNGVAHVDLVVEHNAGMHARRCGVLAPEVVVWRLLGSPVDGRLVEVVQPEALAVVRSTPAADRRFEAMIEAAGATVCREAGIVRAEVQGLEVGRVVDGPDGPVFETGVGRFDREAAALLHMGRDAADSLAAVVAQVLPHRGPDASSDQAGLHPAGRLGRARWLRSRVLEEPALVGLIDAATVDPIPDRGSLLDDGPASIIGNSAEGGVLVMCLVGVQLGLVPEAADQVARHAPDRLCVVLPPRDLLPAVRELCARLPLPVSFAEVQAPW